MNLADLQLVRDSAYVNYHESLSNLDRVTQSNFYECKLMKPCRHVLGI